LDERKLKIAVVEDDEQLAELWTAVLERAVYERCPNCGDVLVEKSFEVERFPDGEAFVVARMSDYDVAIIDLVLRPEGMHGITVIRGASKWVTCVAVSGSSDTDRASAHLAGAKMVVEKPAAIKGIREIVRAALLLYGSRRPP
jgi:DNA-binding response OmpR family regulator